MSRSWNSTGGHSVKSHGSNNPVSPYPLPLKTQKPISKWKFVTFMWNKEVLNKIKVYLPITLWLCYCPLMLSTPPCDWIYPFSANKPKAMKEYATEALKLGYICPSTSSASAGYFFFQKNMDGLRPCSSYWGLNKVTIKYNYPMPLVPEVPEQLKGVYIFTKLNLRSAYNLNSIHECEWKMALSSATGHFKYCVMPYGLSNAPSLVQALINEKNVHFMFPKCVF